MADVHDKATRRKNMRAITHQNTAIEQRVAWLLTDAGIDFTTQQKSLPGTPDFIIEQYRAIIFVHGCFWHGHNCPLFKIPATRTDFWRNKIAGTRQRDQQAIAALSEAGWKVLLVWECALKGRQRLKSPDLRARLEEWLCASEQNSEIDSQGLRLLR